MVRRSTTGKVLANIKPALMMLMMRRISLRWEGVAVGDLGHVIEPPYLTKSPAVLNTKRGIASACSYALINKRFTLGIVCHFRVLHDWPLCLSKWTRRGGKGGSDLLHKVSIVIWCCGCDICIFFSSEDLGKSFIADRGVAGGVCVET